MKLRCLYSNLPEKFRTIEFNDGVNVVLAETAAKSNSGSTHNLGKSLLARIIDFCLLQELTGESFLVDRVDLFGEFWFALEIQVASSEFVTIHRRVGDARHATLIQHNVRASPVGSLPDERNITHQYRNLDLRHAKQVLNSILNLSVIHPWDYRRVVGYLLRSQRDFADPFRLMKFAGKHSDWKPILAQLLGLNGQTVAELYRLEDDQSSLRRRLAAVQMTIKTRGESPRSELKKKRTELEEQQRALREFDLHQIDKQRQQEIAEIERQLATLGERRYHWLTRKNKLTDARDVGRVRFEPERVRKLFESVKIAFAGSIQKDFESLVAFQKSLFEERNSDVAEDLREVSKQLRELDRHINELQQRRTELLGLIRLVDVYAQFVNASEQYARVTADLRLLEQVVATEETAQELMLESQRVEERRQFLVDAIESALVDLSRSPESDLWRVQTYVADVFGRVIERTAKLSVNFNAESHLSFSIDVQSAASAPTLESQGITYSKLLCVAFDLALLRTYSMERYPHWVFHDGVLEAVQDKRKLALMDVIRDYASDGIQYIMTAIDSDVPSLDTRAFFLPNEVVLRLDDSGDSGRLFRMSSW